MSHLLTKMAAVTFPVRTYWYQLPNMSKLATHSAFIDLNQQSDVRENFCATCMDTAAFQELVELQGLGSMGPAVWMSDTKHANSYWEV